MEKSWEEIKRAQYIEKQEIPQEFINAQFPVVDFIDFHVFKGKKQYKITTYRYPSEQQPPKAVLIGIHGLFSYANKLAYFAQKLSQAGIETVAYDQRGHGRSEGDRGVINSVNQLVDDASAFYQKVRSFYSLDIKIFLMGISLGGHIALKLEIEHPEFLSGLVLLCPAISLVPSLKSTWKVQVIKKLGCIFPCIKLKGKSSNSSRNPAVNE